MSGHAYFGVNKEKIRHISLYKNGEYEKIRNVYLYKDGIYQRVWTGASIVTYYDGEDIMGVEEVDEGEDALHPSFSTAKAGYTLYGWKLAPDDQSRVEQKLGTGEPFSLYAYYVPNTLVILSCNIVQALWCSRTEISRNTNYISGKPYADVGMAMYGHNYGAWAENSGSCYVALNEYQNATVAWKFATGNGDFHSAKINGANVSGSGSFNLMASGNISFYAKGYAPAESWVSSICGATQITLSNPTPWT